MQRPCLVVLLSIVLIAGTCLAMATKPMILVFSPDSPGYATELGRIVREDDRIDADVKVLDSSEIFELMLFYPNVKLAVVALGSSVNQKVGLALERFFSQGGGLVGLGFAGCAETTGKCSETVFPIFGTSYINGKFDPRSRCFLITHEKVEEDEISGGVDTFTAEDSKLILSTDVTKKHYLPRQPEKGTYKVLFRDAETGAPTVVKYQNGGCSVTFASFVGEDQEGSFGYFGRFTKTKEFSTLFRNAVYWVWTNEKRYDALVSWIQGYSDRRMEQDEMRQQAEERERREQQEWVLRSILVSALAAAGVALVFRATFWRKLGER